MKAVYLEPSMAICSELRMEIVMVFANDLKMAETKAANLGLMIEKRMVLKKVELMDMMTGYYSEPRMDKRSERMMESMMEQRRVLMTVMTD